MKLLKLAFGCLVLSVGLAGCDRGVKPPEAPLAAKPDYGLEPRGWQVAPEIADEIKALKANDNYRPHRESTRLFVRTQLKYGLERGDYLHKWYDRPLMADIRYAELNDKKHEINIESWKRMAELGKLCGHGFSAFTMASGRDDILSRSRIPGYESEVLVEIVGDCRFEGGRPPDLEGCLKRIKEAIDQPNAFRIDGKVVITSYPRIRIDAMDFYAELKREIIKRFGDKVILMPYFTPFPIEMNRVFDRKELEKAKNELRQALRVVDGLCFASGATMGYNRRQNPRFAVEVAVPIIHSVLSEPEFKNKYLGMPSGCGHENCYRWNYAQDCTGTRNLRDQIELMLALKPDFVNACEWDEENENTHHRPTIAQGFVTSRILRYLTATFEKRAPEVWPNDDTSIPNLAISYRKALLAGEPIEVEVLNIPDGTFKGQEFTVQLKWVNATRRVVREYAPQRLKADELKAAWFVSPATELMSEPILKPELTVWYDGKVKTFAAGLWPLSLHANRMVDFRWVKQTLRDKTMGIRSMLIVDAPDKDGMVEVAGFVESPEELRSVEVLDGCDTVYLFDPKAPKRDEDGMVTVKVAWQGLPWSGSEKVNGTIKIEGAPNAKFVAKKLRTAFVSEREIKFIKAGIGPWPDYVYAEIPGGEVASAEFVADVVPCFSGRVKVKELIAKDIVSMPASAGRNLVFSRWIKARELLPPCGGKHILFAFKMKPSTPDSVLRLQTVDAKYHVDYGEFNMSYDYSNRMVPLTAFERDTETVSTIKIDACRMTPFDYTFSPERGGIVCGGKGLGMDGILCGYTPLVCGYGGAESADGSVALECALNGKMMGWPDTVPQYQKEAKGYSLVFTNCNFVTLPQQVVPEYVGFELETEVYPNEVERRQGIFTTGHAYCQLGIEKGHVFAKLFLRNGYFHPGGRADYTIPGPEIKAGEWSKVRLVWDRKQVYLEVNGKRGKTVPLSGDLFYARHSALGFLDRNDTFFNGKLRRFRVSPK